VTAEQLRDILTFKVSFDFLWYFLLHQVP